LSEKKTLADFWRQMTAEEKISLGLQDSELYWQIPE
jgi:hypothetical protein